MGSLLFSQAKSIYTKARKERELWLEHSPDDVDGANNDYDRCVNRSINEFLKIMDISQVLHQRYIESKTKVYTNYFITIRPKPEIRFIDFYNQVVKYMKRASFIKYRLSFEQKGMNEDDIGHGFHCHIVTLESKWRSKGECLRDTKSSFNKLCEPNCIQVEITKNPLELVESYLIKYESQDNHKMSTQDMDAVWRMNQGLLDIYTEDDELCPRKEPIKSVTGSFVDWE